MYINKFLGNKSILWNKYTALGLLLLITQLLLSASSNFVLIKLGISIAKGTTIPIYYIINLSIYIGLLLLAEIFGAAARLNFDQAVFLAQQTYVTEFANAHKNQVVLNAETTFKENQEVWLISRNSNVIQASLGIFYNIATLGLGVLLNISSISFAGDLRLIISYIISFLIVYLAIKYFKKNLSTLIEESSQNKALLSAILQSGWDNIVIGNKYNWNNWWETFLERLKNARNSSFKELYKQNFSELTIRVLVTLPIFVGTCFLIIININVPSNLIPLLITLPIQVRSIPEICAVATYMNLWNKMNIELTLLTKSLIAPKEELVKLTNQPIDRINWQFITFRSGKKQLMFGSIEQIINYLSSIKCGRLCIRGPNQSGKSTISNLLKQEFMDAIYIPTNSKLFFKSTFGLAVSTGQKMLYQLEELFMLVSQDGNSKVIILDEWDANLDNATLLKVSNLIDNIAKNHKIVEIRHRENS